MRILQRPLFESPYPSAARAGARRDALGVCSDINAEFINGVSTAATFYSNFEDGARCVAARQRNIRKRVRCVTRPDFDSATPAAGQCENFRRVLMRNIDSFEDAIRALTEIAGARVRPRRFQDFTICGFPVAT
jgi:hypothetical protein